MPSRTRRRAPTGLPGHDGEVCSLDPAVKQLFRGNLTRPKAVNCRNFLQHASSAVAFLAQRRQLQDLPEPAQKQNPQSPS